MVGTSDNRFMGTFDGGNHTITFTKTDASTNDCAPFGYIEGATIKDLTIAGSITTSAKYGASIAAHTYGETNITNCHSTVTITGSNSGDGTHGGFVAVNQLHRLSICACGNYHECLKQLHLQPKR